MTSVGYAGGCPSPCEASGYGFTCLSGPFFVVGLLAGLRIGAANLAYHYWASLGGLSRLATRESHHHQYHPH